MSNTGPYLTKDWVLGLFRAERRSDYKMMDWINWMIQQFITGHWPITQGLSYLKDKRGTRSNTLDNSEDGCFKLHPSLFHFI